MVIARALLLMVIAHELMAKGVPVTLELSKDKPMIESGHNFDSDPNGNRFMIKLKNSEMLKGQYFFLVFESENPEFIVSLLGPDNKGSKGEILMDLTTFEGNLAFVMSDTYFNSKLDFFRTNGHINFVISNKGKYGQKDYKIKAEIGPAINLVFGKVYTTRVDININNLKANLRYDGTKYPELQKLRFQITASRQKKNYSLSSTLNVAGNNFEMNTIFPKTVGGVLSLPQLPVCLLQECLYTMEIKMNGIKVMNIESYLIGKVEQLSIGHYEEYYDRVFEENKTTFYELPYDESMEEMDITISLIPVIGTTGLYVNVHTLPLELDKFDWKETGPLAKRITIKWAELVQMKAEKSNIFIAVQTTRPGEYLLKLDAHDPGYKGRLNSGIIESGFSGYDDYNNYLYFFEVFETQEITFSVSMNIISGDADLYMRQCIGYAECMFDNEKSKDLSALKVENNQNSKVIEHTFTCDHNNRNVMTMCQFVVGVKGKENHGTHFEISLQEKNFHRLMVPGHSVPLNMNTDQTVYLKFSHPGRSDASSLLLSIEALWGSFTVVVSKNDSFPKKGMSYTISETFESGKLGLYSALKTISMDPSQLGDQSIQGIYYVAVMATTSCSLNLKFFEKNEDQITVHTLVSGNQVRGELTNTSEIAYYTIKVSLEANQASSVGIFLTPLKGQYLLFANRNGKLPTAENKEFYSMNNHLELSYKSEENSHDEYVIGVKLNLDANTPVSDSYQFLLNLSYANKALKLNPGILTQHILSKETYFFVEVAAEMRSIIIFKSIVDGYSMKLCTWFTSTEESNEEKPCARTADDRNVALHIAEDELVRYCNRKDVVEQPDKCFLQIKVEGVKNQKFSIGFTYNEFPFQLTRQLVVTGPMLVYANAQLNFIYHAEPNKEAGIYFNSKGRDLNIFTKIIRGDAFSDSTSIVFPSEAAHDSENLHKNGFISNIFYSSSTVAAFGSSPEILISVHSASSGEQLIDPMHHFILQMTNDSHEILRTQAHSQDVEEDAWNYFTFYNNGNSDSLRVYVGANVSSRIEVLLSKGLQSKPPYTNKPLATSIGIGNVELKLSSKDLVLDPQAMQDKLKDHYTVAVRSSSNCLLNIFWNNKEEMNYIELTPNIPITMRLETERSLYFSFYAQEAQNKLAEAGVITIYVKSNVETTIYVSHSDGELEAPSATQYEWKGHTAGFGGITMIQIKPGDEYYCNQCLYMATVESEMEGQISLLANVRHSGSPIELTPGFTFPDAINPDEKLYYKVTSGGADQVDITISMMSGYISVYVSDESDLSEAKFKESHFLEDHLDSHRFIPLQASKFGGKPPTEYFILITNTRHEIASFTIDIDRNNLISPIQPGVTKFFHLGPSETTDFIYAPREEENSFEVRLELRQVMDDEYKAAALDYMARYVSLSHVDERGGRYSMKLRKTSISGNKAFFSFDISQNTQGKFAIHITNPLSSPLAFAVDLLNGNYKLLSFNKFNVDRLRRSESIIYEGYGQSSKLLFVDVKMCHGNVNVEFFQDDYENLAKENTTEFKRIVDANSFVHYVRLEKERLFLRVKNTGDAKAIYEISVFNERDLDNNPYSEVAQGNDGQVHVELDTNQVKFSPLQVNSTYSSEFYHVVNYTLFISDEKAILDYGKNCGNYMIEHVWKNPHLLSFSTSMTFNSAAEIENHKEQITLQINDMKENTRYHGIVVARIDLFPKEGGFVAPVRSGKVYYDDFIFITPKLSIPLNLWVAILVCSGFFCFLFCIVRSYVFGSINRLRNFEKLTDLSGFDEGEFGLNMMSMLEKEYYQEESQKSEETTEEVPEEPKMEENGGQTIEMSDMQT